MAVGEEVVYAVKSGWVINLTEILTKYNIHAILLLVLHFYWIVFSIKGV